MSSPRTLGLCASLILVSGGFSTIAALLSNTRSVAAPTLSAGKAEIVIQEYVDAALPRRLTQRIQKDLVGRLNVSPREVISLWQNLKE